MGTETPTPESHWWAATTPALGLPASGGQMEPPGREWKALASVGTVSAERSWWDPDCGCCRRDV